jgi:hypothetical protein
MSDVKCWLSLLLLLLSYASSAQTVCPRPSASGGIAVCDPKAGATVSSPVLIYALGGTAVTAIEAWVDGAKARQTSTNTLDTTISLSNGSHRLVTFAKVNGTLPASDTRTFTVSTSSSCSQPSTAGSVKVCTPSNGATVDNPVSISARGGSSVTSLEAWVDGVKKTSAAGNNLSYSISLAGGGHRLTVIAKVGGSESARQTVNFTVTSSTGATLVVETVAAGLNIPWEMVFAPDGRKFFTERVGRLRVISASGTLRSTPMYQEKSANTEAGMLGLALTRRSRRITGCICSIVRTRPRAR